MKSLWAAVAHILMTVEYLMADDDYNCDMKKHFPIIGLKPSEFKCEDPGMLLITYIFSFVMD